MKLAISPLLLVVTLWLFCCSTDNGNTASNADEDMSDTETTNGTASITEVDFAGGENQYTFSATISSPDLGCQQYADWWEVIDINGNLLYRRILSHSHVNEQPFTRAGGPLTISENTEVYVRAHMNTTGYGSKVFKGSIAKGFVSDNLDVEFAKSLEEVAPLPGGCAF